MTWPQFVSYQLMLRRLKLPCPHQLELVTHWKRTFCYWVCSTTLCPSLTYQQQPGNLKQQRYGFSDLIISLDKVKTLLLLQKCFSPESEGKRILLSSLGGGVDCLKHQTPELCKGHRHQRCV